MNVFKKHFRTTLSPLLIVTAMTTGGALESKANKFDRGFLPPASSAKARRTASFYGTGVYRTRAIRVGVGNLNGDNSARIVFGPNGRRIFVNGLYRDALGRNRKSFILPYIEHDNLYR